MPSGFHTWSQTAATDATADSAINWSEGQAPSSVNDSARAMMAVLAKWRDDNNGSLTTGGTSTAFTLTSNTGFTTLPLMDKQSIAFTVNATSGAAPTMNVDALGAKPIRNSTGVTLPTGALLSGSIYRATYYNTAGEFLLENQAGVLPTNSVVTASITDANVTLAKIVNTGASRLLGNPTGGATVPSEISLGTGLAFVSSSLVSSVVKPTTQIFTSGTSQTYTTPANVKWIAVQLVGGGSGGGGGQNGSASGAGVATTFSTFTAGGGTGSTNVIAGAGGGASGGLINIAGSAGGSPTCPGISFNANGGSGAGSALGGGGAGSTSSNTGSAGGTNSGGGGGGGGASNGTLTGSSGAGGASGGYVFAMINAPAATYTYSVGAGGSGAAGGSSSSSAGGTGGAGAAGIIIVTEYY